MPYDPNRAPWDQDYAAPQAPTPSPQAQPSQEGFALPVLGHQPSLETYLRNAPTERGLSGDVSRLGLGFIQGMAGPAEWAAKQIEQRTGTRLVPESVRAPARLVQRAAQTGEGTAGEVAGAFFNPVNRAITEVTRPIEWASDLGGPTLRAIGRIARSMIAGGAGGAVAQPGDTQRNALWGAGIGGALGLPGALAAKLGFGNAQQLVGRLGRLPFVQDAIRVLKETGEGGFNRFWYRHALAPIGGGKVPAAAGREGLDDVSRQIGDAITKATAGMTLDATSAPVIPALAAAVGRASNNLLDTGSRAAFQGTIDGLVLAPLNRLGRFDAGQLQSVVSNLASRIRDIPGRTDAQRELKAALEDFRMTLLSNASGGDQTAWRNARQAWARFATGRDAARGTRDGIFSPDALANAIEQRQPQEYGTGRAFDQRIADQASQAMTAPGRAAKQAAGGLPLTQPQDWAARTAAAANQRPVSPPPTYYGLTPGL